MTAEWELGESDLVLLREAVDVTDRCARLGVLARKTSPVISGRLGQLQPNPVATELRAERRLLLQLLAALGLTADAEEVRPQLAAVRELKRRAG